MFHKRTRTPILVLNRLDTWQRIWPTFPVGRPSVLRHKVCQETTGSEERQPTGPITPFHVRPITLRVVQKAVVSRVSRQDTKPLAFEVTSFIGTARRFTSDVPRMDEKTPSARVAQLSTARPPVTKERPQTFYAGRQT